MHINPNIPPPNGFKFLNHDGTVIKGNGWKQLERNLLEYRRRTGGKTDNLWDEIVAQVCAAAPGFCKEGSGATPMPVQPQQQLKSRMLSWLSQHQKGNHGQVSAAQAQQRVATCLACKCRKEVQVGCSGCMRAINEMRKKLLNGTQPISAALGTCDVLGSDLSVAVHLSEPTVVNPALPANCWRKKS
jgi:hypothetical protein